MSTRFQKCSAGSILLYSVAVSWQLFLVFALLRLRSVRGNPVAVVSGQSGVCRLDSSRVRLSFGIRVVLETELGWLKQTLNNDIIAQSQVIGRQGNSFELSLQNNIEASNVKKLCD